MATDVPQVDPLDGLKTLFDPTTCVRKGLCPVTKKAKASAGAQLESHSLYFEQHGTGPEKVLFIMGLNSTSFAWAPQLERFGRSSLYSMLVFDNRGVGNSDSPRGPYTTKSMAEDVVTLLDYIGWTEKRALHVVGISMGGMIAQELVFQIPERLVSLSLIVTTPGGRPWTNLPSWKGVNGLARILLNSDNEKRIPVVLGMVFPAAWLDAKNETDAAGRTNREVQAEVLRKRFKVTRPQPIMGHISQMSAGLTHRVTPDRLAQIAKTVPKVLILTGDDDNLVDPRNSEYMARHMPEAEFVKWDGTGHGIHAQWPDRLNTLLIKVFEEGRKRVDERWAAK